MMPAARIGKDRTCWTEGHALCVRQTSGHLFKGRDCCGKAGVDEEFKLAEADLHNLAPAVGEVNGDRSNHPYGIFDPAGDPEPRQYGTCDFELGGSPKVAEPAPGVRGDLARAWLYMADTYPGMTLTVAERALMEAWHAADSVTDWELLRDERIEAAQGNKNPFVRN